MHNRSDRSSKVKLFVWMTVKMAAGKAFYSSHCLSAFIVAALWMGVVRNS